MSETESVQEEVQQEQAPLEQVQETLQEQVAGTPEVEQQEEPVEQQVPLSALQKERKKRQDAEQRAKLYEDMQAQALREKQQAQPKEDDDEEFEAVTKADLSKYQHKIMQQVDEKNWIRQNPEKTAEIQEKLTDFLNQRPHLKLAIEAAPNRYEEAWNLMNALTPRQKMSLKPNAQIKKDAPGSPSTLPKATGMNQAVDVMTMNDTEYLAWRKAQKQRR